MIFTAFDFEKIGDSALTAIELGVAVFNDNQLIETRSWRFSPAAGGISRHAIRRHGIQPADIAGLEMMDAKWEQMEPYFRGVMIAHNAGSDVSPLCQTLDHFGVARPDAVVYCTRQLAEAHLGNRKYALEVLCRDLRIPHSPHHAASDAEAAGRLLLYLADRQNGLKQFLQDARRPVSIAGWVHSAESRNSWYGQDDVLPNTVNLADSLDARDTPEETECNNELLDAVLASDATETAGLLAGWRFAISGDPAGGEGKSKLVRFIQKLGGHCHVDGKLLKRQRENAPYSPANVLLICESMLTEILHQQRNPTTKLKHAFDMRHGKCRSEMKLIAENDLLDIVKEKRETDCRHFPWDDYRENSPAIVDVWQKLREFHEPHS